MSDSVARLLARADQDYQSGNHRAYVIDDLVAMAIVANYVAGMVAAAQAAQAAAEAALATMQSLGASAYSIGLDPLDLPRAGDMGSAAFQDWEVQNGSFTLVANSALQITAHHHGMLLLSTSGANTWTLPATTDVPDGFFFRYHNISGSNLVIQRAGSDTINGAVTTSVTIATGAAIGRSNKRNASTIWQIG